MTPYFIVYFIVIFCSFFLMIEGKYRNIFYYSFSIIIVSSLVSLFYLRDISIGIDTHAYMTIFTDLIRLDSIKDVFEYAYNNNFEIGFVFLSYIIGSSFGVKFLFIFYAIIIYLNYILVLKDIKINPILYFMSFFSYFGIYLWSLNILRQMVAVSLVVLGVSYLLKGMRKQFILFVLVASLFHYSAFICLIFIVLMEKIDFFYKNRFLLILITIILSKFILIMVSSFYARYSTYATVSNMENIGISLMIFYIFTFLINDIFGKYIKYYANHFKFFIVIFSFYIALQSAFLINGISNYGTTRVVIYFLWPSIFIWGIFIKNIFDLNTRMFFSILFSILLFFYWYLVLSKSGSSVVPFKYFIF